MEEQEREREGVAIGTPARSERKRAAVEQDVWAATPWGVGGREVLTNTEVLIRQRSS